MNHSESRLRTNPRIVPPDLLLKFGYSPSGGIEFDSAAQTLSFYQGGTKRVDINSFGLAVRNGEGLVVGHTAQLSIGGGIQEFQVIGASFDAEMAVATFRNDAFGPGFRFLKSRATTPGDNVADPGTYNDGDDLGFIRWHVDDGADYASYAAQIFVEADDTAFAENDVPGRMIFATTPDGAASPTEALRIDSSQNVQMRSESYFWIGPDSAATGFVDANLTVGLVINQEGNDDKVLIFKSSDATLGTFGGEADTYASFAKEATTGGLNIVARGPEGGSQQAVLKFSVFGGAPEVDKTTGGRSLIEYDLRETASNAAANMTADANMFGIRAFVGGTLRTLFIIDEDGEIFADGGVSSTDMVTLFDGENDIALTRSLSHAMSKSGSKGLVDSRFDDWVDTNEGDLVRLNIIGAPLSEGGLINYTGLARLNTGAIWQQQEQHLTLVERVDELEGQLAIANTALAALTA